MIIAIAKYSTAIPPKIKRENKTNSVVKEVINVRDNVGLIEVANFAKHEFKGPESRKLLDHILAGKLPKPGRISLSPMYRMLSSSRGSTFQYIANA